MSLISRFTTTSLSIFYVLSNKMKMTTPRLFASKASGVLEFRESSETLTPQRAGIAFQVDCSPHGAFVYCTQCLVAASPR